MPRKKKFPIESEDSTEVISVAAAAPKRTRTPRTASASPSRKGGAASEEMIRSEQPATESAIPAAAFQDPTNQTEAEQILQCAVSEQEQVALLAYSYWQARGCQGGSPEDDWYRAEREVRNGGKQASDVQ